MILPDIRHLPPGEEIPFGVHEAQDYLELLLSITEMLRLYQECFPEAFQRDQEQDVPIFPTPTALYSQREVNFFHLVDEYYFPVPVDFLPDDPYGERRLATSIPIEPMGLEIDEEDQYEELDFGWKLLLYLLGAVNEEWLCTCSEQASDALFEIPLERGKASEVLLVERSKTQGGALAYLMQAVQMLQNETESVWLNVTMDDPCMDALWTKEDMEEISRQYSLALDIRTKAVSFCAWLEENPCKHFSFVARLWNSCVRDAPKGGTGPRIMQLPASTFVEGINFGELFGRHIALPEYRGNALLAPGDAFS